jgi:hypothetical protein
MTHAHVTAPLPDGLAQICFIGGSGHSGTTLLGLILGSHREGFFCGEAINARLLHATDKPHGKGVCKLCGPDCRIWTGLNDGPDLYHRIAVRAGRTRIIDSTKDVSWIDARSRALAEKNTPTALVFMLRDGRAVLNSYIRRYPGRSTRQLVENWLSKIRSMRALHDRFPGAKAMVHYERLALNPEGEVRTLCGLLGIDYRPDMLHFYRHQHHPLGGNDGTQLLLARADAGSAKAAPVVNSPWQIDYYRSRPLGIELDLRWKQELSADDLRLFDDMVGGENDPFRFDS